MLSSISNSKAHSWFKCWIVALAIAASLFATLEVFWRLNGHNPAIVDDQRLWSIERSKIGQSGQQIVLLGSSRMETDISTAMLRRLNPHREIINLSVSATCANATLRDLAQDPRFNGTVIMETSSECLMFGDNPELSQQSHVDYYHRVFNLNAKANRIIATFFQKKLAVIDPYLNLIKVAGDRILKHKWRAPNYVTKHEDRSSSADYTKLDISHHKAIRLKKVTEHYTKLSPYISVSLLEEKIGTINQDVKKIQNRGGQVAFVRFPVSGEHWIIDEKYFPRNIYWDPFIPLTSAKVIHFKDIDGINKMQCPDTSHLDMRDTPEFTMLLVNELVRNSLL